jgi:hypothetical protein
MLEAPSAALIPEPEDIGAGAVGSFIFFGCENTQKREKRNAESKHQGQTADFYSNDLTQRSLGFRDKMDGCLVTVLTSRMIIGSNVQDKERLSWP